MYENLNLKVAGSNLRSSTIFANFRRIYGAAVVGVLAGVCEANNFIIPKNFLRDICFG